mmetsp:Transcript_11212/g.41556  ORF Transcript_11212/g.41556 Transcript_11212/m.41556 type:complete len:299 (-) Transcript_11212:1709-2605(-)
MYRSPPPWPLSCSVKARNRDSALSQLSSCHVTSWSLRNSPLPSNGCATLNLQSPPMNRKYPSLCFSSSSQSKLFKWLSCPYVLLFPPRVWPYSSPISTIGVPWLTISARCRFFICRTRSACTASFTPSPSPPWFQLSLSLHPSRFCSPFASLCLSLYETRSRNVNPSCAVMKFKEWYGLRLLLWYKSALPERRHASSLFNPPSPLTNLRKTSRYRPFHSPHRSQLGKLPTWYRPPQSQGSANSFVRSKVSSLAIPLITGGRWSGSPSSPRVMALVKSNRNPSTWYSSTQCRNESNTKR